MEHKHSTEQKTIFNWFILGRNHAAIEAVAGSGKTYTLIHGLNISNSPKMLYCVFGKRNQVEAEKKITNKKVQVSTYHSLGYKMILANWRGVKANSYTEFGRVKQLAPDAPAQVHFQVSRLVDFIKNTCITVPNLIETIKIANERDIDAGTKNPDWTTEKLAELAIKSVNLCLEYPSDKQISFSDMVFLPVAKGWVKPSYSLIVSDESQDLSAPQLAMIKGLCEPNGRICLVGDSAQAIFGFRGSVFDSISKFQLELNADKFTLSTSYRCPKKIVSLAQVYVPSIRAADNAIEGEITTVNHDKMLNDIKVTDVILSRSNAPLTKSCLALIRKGKPAYILGRDIGQQLIKTIESFDTNNISEFFTKLDAWLAIKQANATLWNSNQVANSVDTHETLRVLAEDCLDVESIKNKINKLFMDSEFVRVPSVTLSTVHKFKGLENDNINLLTWTFASGKRVTTPEQAQEERNIIYVAYSRSKNKLVNVSES